MEFLFCLLYIPLLLLQGWITALVRYPIPTGAITLLAILVLYQNRSRIGRWWKKKAARYRDVPEPSDTALLNFIVMEEMLNDMNRPRRR